MPWYVMSASLHGAGVSAPHAGGTEAGRGRARVRSPSKHGVHVALARRDGERAQREPSVVREAEEADDALDLLREQREHELEEAVACAGAASALAGSRAETPRDGDAPNAVPLTTSSSSGPSSAGAEGVAAPDTGALALSALPQRPKRPPPARALLVPLSAAATAGAEAPLAALTDVLDERRESAGVDMASMPCGKTSLYSLQQGCGRLVTGAHVTVQGGAAMGMRAAFARHQPADSKSEGAVWNTALAPLSLRCRRSRAHNHPVSASRFLTEASDVRGGAPTGDLRGTGASAERRGKRAAGAQLLNRFWGEESPAGSRDVRDDAARDGAGGMENDLLCEL
jgi:hypothetical protein